MGTRAVIARLETDGSLCGRYHHWDGYPTGLGNALLRIIRDQFSGDVDKALSVLVDEHPGGWSSITKADFTKRRPGFQNPPMGMYGNSKRARAILERYEQTPHCYCHGRRHDTEGPIRSFEDAGFAPYVYVIQPQGRTLALYERVYDAEHSDPIFGRFKLRSLVALDGSLTFADDTGKLSGPDAPEIPSSGRLDATESGVDDL